jgi:uncharacterized protein involved in cysteine biosynthesis
MYYFFKHILDSLDDFVTSCDDWLFFIIGVVLIVVFFASLFFLGFLFDHLHGFFVGRWSVSTTYWT